MSDSQKNIDYCRDMVQRDDRERYETVLFAARSVQPRLWVLYAFNQEVAKTRENVSEPALGEIRLQWWRDAIEELRKGTAREHPVVQAMQSELAPADLFALLEELVDARAQDLYDEGPVDQPALEGYALAVGGTLAEAALRLSVESEPDEHLVGLARATGGAWAMLGLVRAIPFHWASNRNYVPGDKGRASLATTDADKMFALAAPSIAEMISFSRRHLNNASSSITAIPDSARHIFLSNIQLGLHLGALDEVEGNPFKSEQPGTLKRLTRMMWAMITGRFY